MKAGGKEEAIQLAKAYVQAGYSVDMGLMQVNSRNLGWLNLTIDQVFDQCTNVRAGTEILRRNYLQAGGSQQALPKALSAYNTGNHRSGFYNGYVGKIYSANDKLRGKSP